MNDTNQTNHELLNRIVSCLTDALTNNVLAKIEPRLSALEMRAFPAGDIEQRLTALETNLANINYTPETVFRETIKELCEDMVEAAIKDADIDGRVESEADNAVERSIENVDWDEKVHHALQNHDLSSMVEEILDDTVEDKVREVIDNMTVTLSV